MKHHSLGIMILVLCLVLSGCAKGDNEHVISQTDTVQRDNLPEHMTAYVPYDDIRHDDGELGDHRMVNGEISMELSRHIICSDSDTIESVLSLLNTENMTAQGAVIDDQMPDSPSIQLEFDRLYYVWVYPNGTVVTQTFYTEGDKYERLVNEYYAENGVYPRAISDGLWKYAAKDTTYPQLSRILRNCAEEEMSLSS